MAYHSINLFYFVNFKCLIISLIIFVHQNFCRYPVTNPSSFHVQGDRNCASIGCQKNWCYWCRHGNTRPGSSGDWNHAKLLTFLMQWSGWVSTSISRKKCVCWCSYIIPRLSEWKTLNYVNGYTIHLTINLTFPWKTVKLSRLSYITCGKAGYPSNN